MNLAAWAIRNRPIVITIVVLLMIWGVYSATTMPRREDPEYTVRTCAVTTIWPGAPAEKIEELITKPLEEAIDTIPEVKEVRSTTVVGMSSIYVDAEDSTSSERIDNVWDKVRARVARVQMPEQGLTPDVNDEFGDTYILVLAVYQRPLGDPTSRGNDAIRDENRYTPRQLDVISEKIRDELRLLDGVSKVDQFGVREEAIFIETDMATWSKLSLTSGDLEKLAQARNIVAPGGSIDTESGRFSVKPGGEFNAVAEMNSIVAGLVQSDETSLPVYLTDLGLKISRDYTDPPRYVCRYGDAETSEPCVIVGLTMKSGGNIVNICEAAKARVAAMQKLEKVLPSDIAVTPISDQSVNVAKKISDVVINVIEAILIVIVIVYLIVGLRSAFVMAANIPVVVLASVALITLFGVELEQISLASIIIALGLLVDNAVQVCDQSRSNQIAGMEPVEATVVGSRQLASPMFMGTATTVAAFFPMLIALDGSTREYVYSLPVTLSVTLGISWVLAMTFCTVLAASLIRRPAHPDRPDAPIPRLIAKITRSSGQNKPGESDPIDRLFRSVSRTAIRAKFLTLSIAFALFAACLALPVGSEFFPKDIRDQFAIKIWLPENVTIEQTDKVTRQVESILRKLSPTTGADGETVQRIRAMRSMVGGGGTRWYLSWDPESAKANFAEILVRTTDGQYTPWLARRVREVAERGDESLGIDPIVGARIVPNELFLGPSKPPVEIRVFGPGFANMQTLRGYAEQVKQMVRDEPGTWDVHDTWGVTGYQLRVDVDEAKANLAGVSNASLAQSLNAYFSGHRLTTFREGDHTVPIYLRLAPEERTSLSRLDAAFVEGEHGKVPLSSIATNEVRWEPARIERRDMNRVIEVRSEVEPGVRGNDVAKRIMDSPEMSALQKSMAGGFRVEVGGNLKESNESAGKLANAMAMSVLTIVMLLVIQYNGWAKPVIILTTLPLALIGALPGLWITGNPLGFMPQLGILSLFGIVLNTGIIFIEFADMLILDAAQKSDGRGPICGLTTEQFRECLVEAGKQRLLPIFLTTATTIGGLLPLALAGGPLWEGMAWSMIFGLAIATLLTLLVVPALYAIFVETLGVQPVESR